MNSHKSIANHKHFITININNEYKTHQTLSSLQENHPFQEIIINKTQQLFSDEQAEEHFQYSHILKMVIMISQIIPLT